MCQPHLAASLAECSGGDPVLRLSSVWRPQARPHRQIRPKWPAFLSLEPPAVRNKRKTLVEGSGTELC